MAKFIVDIEIHSKYARAVSQQMVLENLALWADKKGIQVMGTGDFTHPLWFKDIKEKLEPAEPGLYRLRNTAYKMRFMLTGEVSCVYTKAGRGRRVHHLIYAPSIEVAEKINTQLGWLGNLKSDGRPILGLDSKELLKVILNSSPESVLIPAHVWTPWFGVFGSKSGFNSLVECFDELEPQIFAIETGLSSDPPMNWRVPFLDEKAIMSSSDSHSLHRLGREATIFDADLSYSSIMRALRSRGKEFVGTIEFFPEEGKYHYDGHLACGVRLTPEETKKNKGLCPSCGKPVTVGVMARVEELADPKRTQAFKPSWAKEFHSFVPFDEVIAEAMDVGVQAKAVWKEYDKAIDNFGSELNLMLNVSAGDLKSGLPPAIAEGVLRVRGGKLHIEPGYDGEYGKIKIFNEKEREEFSNQKNLL